MGMPDALSWKATQNALLTWIEGKADGEESQELSPGLTVWGSVSGLWAMTLHASPHCSLRARPSVEAKLGLSLLLRCGHSYLINSLLL